MGLEDDRRVKCEDCGKKGARWRQLEWEMKVCDDCAEIRRINT